MGLCMGGGGWVGMFDFETLLLGGNVWVGLGGGGGD